MKNTRIQFGRLFIKQLKSSLENVIDFLSKNENIPGFFLKLIYSYYNPVFVIQH